MAWPDARAAAAEPKLEYVVHAIRLQAATPFDWATLQQEATDPPAAIEAWRRSGTLARITTWRLTAANGQEAEAETVSDRNVEAEQTRFAGHLRDRTKLVPAIERTTSSVTIRGTIENGAIVGTISCRDVVQFLPDEAAAIKSGETKPSLEKISPQGTTGSTTIKFNDGKPCLIGGCVTHTKGPDKPVRATADLVIVTGRIVTAPIER